MSLHSSILPLFFFNDTATTEIYTLSLHDALPILANVNQASKTYLPQGFNLWQPHFDRDFASIGELLSVPLYAPWFVTQKDRKSTRLNSSHQIISYAVFCLKKKNTP